MTFFLLLLALQAEQDPPASVRSGGTGHNFHGEVGPIFQYWLPSFRGQMRVDGSNTRGSYLRLVRDLDLSDEPAIPMYGGGEFAIYFSHNKEETDEFLLSAEYWAHGWSGHETLSLPEALGDHSFAAGSSVESRFHLTWVTLDASLSHLEEFFRAGVTLSLGALSARLRVESPGVSSKESIDDIFWGGGVFLDLKPVTFLFGGLSLKGFTSFAELGNAGVGDFRAYAGAEWGPFRLEGGYRYLNYHLGLPDEHLHYVLYGPYVAFSLILRF